MHGMPNRHWFVDCLVAIFAPLQGVHSPSNSVHPSPLTPTSKVQTVAIICGYCGAKDPEPCFATCERFKVVERSKTTNCTHCGSFCLGTACLCSCHPIVKKETPVPDVVVKKGCTCTTISCVHVPFDKNVTEYRVDRKNFYACCFKFLAAKTAERTFYPQDGHKMYCPKCNGKLTLDGKVWRLSLS